MEFKTIVLLLLSYFISPCMITAQKKELSQARSILKSGRGVEQAEQLMTGLLKDSTNRENKRIYALWYEAVLKQYEAVNEKLYMKQRQDTAQFFELTRRLFNVAESLDSLDMQPDRKGRIDPEYRKQHAEQLMKFRPNLFFGCTYYIKHSDFKKAFEFSETYMDCANQPLFTAYRLDSTDTRMAEAAYWATYCGFRMNDPVLTLRHRYRALQDSTKTDFTLQYMAEARRWLKDDSLYLETLLEGFRHYPQNTYFFPRLMDYYTARGQNEQALKTVNRVLEINDSSELYQFAKLTVLFNMGRYDECIMLCNKLIGQNDTLPDPYYYAGTSYLNKVLKLHPLRNKKEIRKTYQEALPYMERYRKLAPNQKQKWAPVLYRIYLNLNMGRQFDEIDQLLKS